MINSTSIPTGEFVWAGAAITVHRTGAGTITVKTSQGRRLGYLTAEGRHEGRSVLAALEAVASGQAPALVRCPTCHTPLTDPASRAAVQAGSWVCSGVAS